MLTYIKYNSCAEAHQILNYLSENGFNFTGSKLGLKEYSETLDDFIFEMNNVINVNFKKRTAYVTWISESMRKVKHNNGTYLSSFEKYLSSNLNIDLNKFKYQQK